MWLRQSTSRTVKLGPFLDETDGKTAETALTISQADIRLSKNGGAFAQTNNAAGAAHDENGHYGVPLDTTDTNTLGALRVAVHESGALPVWQDFMVLPANVWDALFGTDKLEVDAVEISGDAAAADNLETMLDGSGGQTLSLKQLNVVNNAGDAIVATSTGSNGRGIAATGHGTGDGLICTGGVSGPSGGAGIAAIGQGGGEGVYVEGGATGIGLQIEGGATSGAAIQARANGGGQGLYLIAAGNNDALELIGSGSGDGIHSKGGSTGHGFRTTGGATSGDGILTEAVGASSHGITAVGGASGKDLNATTTDNLSVSLSSAERDAIATSLLTLANGVETNFDLREVLRLMAAVLLGESTKSGNAHTYRDLNDTKNRVTATATSSGRSSVAYDPS